MSLALEEYSIYFESTFIKVDTSEFHNRRHEASWTLPPMMDYLEPAKRLVPRRLFVTDLTTYALRWAALEVSDKPMIGAVRITHQMEEMWIRPEGWRISSTGQDWMEEASWTMDPESEESQYMMEVTPDSVMITSLTEEALATARESWPATKRMIGNLGLSPKSVTTRLQKPTPPDCHAGVCTFCGRPLAMYRLFYRDQVKVRLTGRRTLDLIDLVCPPCGLRQGVIKKIADMLLNISEDPSSGRDLKRIIPTDPVRCGFLAEEIFLSALTNSRIKKWEVTSSERLERKQTESLSIVTEIMSRLSSQKSSFQRRS